ncbi:hypothetical protein BN2497_10453 [Janthinobacterium sp. CG23_2]|nr:hypothetical protein BN2497_75 [Janthinobacterium sp. CG23_2]CUI03911.1 hypothetical protein BN2497_2599 [Janthinobacterium sp. CG23_2]CUI07838.1 hypothetical protein BN2497_10453 [Janthinobacterium sp. CG23_2]CUU26435.1 hypothetical protein BN3177_75 [Janthinobacterium sp. CG23_2]CUU27697.1 hypothetical protein BN3177_2599 [Janthinobacterium sp. CG23_2]
MIRHLVTTARLIRATSALNLNAVAFGLLFLAVLVLESNP